MNCSDTRSTFQLISHGFGHLPKINIPYANLSGSVFDGANLSCANLNNVDFAHAYLRDVSLTNAKMKNINLVEHSLLKYPHKINSISHHPKKPNLLVIGMEKGLLAVKRQTKETLEALQPEQNGRAYCANFNSEGNLLASICDNKRSILVWSFPKRSLLKVLPSVNRGGTYRALSFNHNGNILAAAQEFQNKHTLHLFEMPSGKYIKQLLGYTEDVLALAFCKITNSLFSAGSDNTIKIWPTPYTNCEVLTGHDNNINCLAISPNGRWLASGSSDTTIRIWDLHLSPKKCSLVLDGHTGHVTALVFTQDNTALISASRDTSIIVWDIPSGAQTRTLTGHAKAVTCATISPDGQWLITGSTDKTIRQWHIGSRNISHRKKATKALYPH